MLDQMEAIMGLIKKLARNTTIQVGEKIATTAGKIQLLSTLHHAINMPRNLNHRGSR